METTSRASGQGARQPRENWCMGQAHTSDALTVLVFTRDDVFSPELKSYLITQWNCTTIGSCRCRKTNQWVGSGAAQTYGDDTRQIPAETGGASGYISGRFAIGSSGLLRLKWRLSRAATWHSKVRSTRSVSQGTEVTIVTEYVPYRYSTRTASCKDAYGNWI